MTLRIRPVLRPLKAWLSDVVGGTGHRTQFRRGIELALRCDDERTGLGEASPLPHFSEEHLEDVEAELVRIVTFDAELPTSPAECRAWIEHVSAPFHVHVASARFAFEGALVDLLAQHFGIPAASLLAQMTNSGSPGRELEVSRLLPTTDLPRLLGAARVAWARGYRTLKLKLGPIESFESDAKTLEALHEQLPPTVKIRLDPNGSWPLSALPRLLERLSRFSPELIEEPAEGSKLLALDTSPVPLALDESLRTAGLLDQLAPHLTRLDIRAVVVKPALLGLLTALDLAVKAKSLGLDVIVTHLFDGPVGHATAVSLAQAVGTTTRAHGLAPHPGLLLCPERRIMGLGHGQLSLGDKAGLPLSEVTH